MVQDVEENTLTYEQKTENNIRSAEPVTMKSLLEAGVHFGHQTRRWNPHMKPFIFTHRNGIHIIDLQQTLFRLEQACNFVTQMVANGGRILFVGTKKQAQSTIEAEAARCGMMYVNQRWLGGTLTNFATIRSRINHMLDLMEKREGGYFQQLSKKEALKQEEELARLQKYLRGLKDMDTIPEALFVIDLQKERLCVAEAHRMGVSLVAVVDSDCDPLSVDYIIPGNDDAIRSIKLMSAHIADAVIEGLSQREAILKSQQDIDDPDEISQEEMPEDIITPDEVSQEDMPEEIITDEPSQEKEQGSWE